MQIGAEARTWPEAIPSPAGLRSTTLARSGETRGYARILRDRFRRASAGVVTGSEQRLADADEGGAPPVRPRSCPRRMRRPAGRRPTARAARCGRGTAASARPRQARRRCVRARDDDLGGAQAQVERVEQRRHGEQVVAAQRRARRRTAGRPASRQASSPASTASRTRFCAAIAFGFGVASSVVALGRTTRPSASSAVRK